MPVTTRPSGSGASADVDGPVGDNGWFNGTVNVTLTAGSDSVLQYRVNGGAWNVYSGPIQVDTDARSHLVEFGSQADVAAGRTGSAKFSLDATDPWTHVNLTSIISKGRSGGDDRDEDDADGGDDADDDQAYDSETGERRNIRGGDDDDDDDDRDDEGEHLGWFRNVTLVRLRGTDNLSGAEGTYYRLNNGSWQPYTGAFFLKGEGNHTLEYRSLDRAGNEEETRTIRFGHDASAPESNDTVENPPEDDGSGDDGSGDDGSGDDGSGDGSSGGDNATEEPTTAPAPTPENGWYNQSIALALNATDNLSGVAVIKYSTNNASYENYTLPILYSVDGVYVTTYFSTDLAGNNETSRNVTLRIDATPPSLRDVLSGPEGQNGWFLGNVTLTVEAADATSGVATVDTAVDGGAFQSYVDALEFTEEGAYDAVTRARDLAGNTITRTVKVGVDWTAPWTTATVTGEQDANGFFVGQADIVLDGTDNVSGVRLTEYSLDGAPFQTYSKSITVASDGKHTLAFRSTDEAGNVADAREVEFTVDALAPVTKLRVNDAPAAWRSTFATNDTTPTLTLVPEDYVSGVAATTYRVDDGPDVPYTGAFSVSGEGAHVLTYWSVDKAGHVESERSTTVLVDTVAPASVANVTGDVGENGWFVTDATVTFEATDDSSGVAGVYYSLDGSAYRVAGKDLVIGEGEHVLAYYAQDAAGNKEPLKVVSILVDGSAPETAAALDGTEGRDGWYTSDLVVNLTASDATSGVTGTFASVDGAEPVLVDAPITFTEDGTHVIEYWSVDAAGNVEDTQSLTVKVDREAANVQASVHGTPTDTDGSTYNGPVAVTFDASDETSGVDVVFYRVNGGTWYKTPKWPLPFWNKGDYVVEYFAVDAAGIESAVKQVAFTVTYPGT